MKIQTKTTKRQNCPGTGALKTLIPALALLACPAPLFALGFLVPNQDAAAIARGNAFAATADNPSAIYYNPAGISQLPGFNAQIGDLNYIGIDVTYDGPSGSHTETKFENITVPQIYLTYSPTNVPLTFGLGVYAPFGLGVKWPADSPLRSQAINSQLYYFTVNPVVAWQVTKSLSLAIGPTINYAKIKFNRGLFSPDSDYFEFRGEDVSAGLTAGFLWQPHPKWSIGASYRLASTMDFDGSSSYAAGPTVVGTARTTARVPFPQIISGGISFRPTSKWNFEADVDYINWDTLNTVTLDGTRNIFGVDLPLQLDWHNSWQVKFGATRYFNDGWYMSAGYFFSSSTTSSEHYTPAVPDTDLHVGSLGLGRNFEHWHWALAGQIIAGPTRTITTTAAAGTYQIFVPTLTFSVGYRF